MPAFKAAVDLLVEDGYLKINEQEAQAKKDKSDAKKDIVRD